MSNLTTFVLFLCCSFIYAQEEFVANLLQKLPEYVQENNLDPSDILTELSPVHLTGIDAEFTNYQVFGHSKTNVTIQSLRFYVPTQNVIGWLDVTMLQGNENTTLEGNYNLNGTISSNVTIFGNGRWTARPLTGSQFTVYIRYDDVHLSEDGLYANLKGYRSKQGIILFYGTKEYKLEGLVAGGQEERITNVVMNSYLDLLRGNKKLLIPAQIMQYLEDTFGNTPISDMQS